MNFEIYLKRRKTQKIIDKLAKKYKNKKILCYGAGTYAEIIFTKYDLSKLNIIGISDKKFEENEVDTIWGYKAIQPRDIKTLDFDIVLVTNYDYKYFERILDQIGIVDVYNNKKTIIIPIVKYTLKEKFESLISKYNRYKYRKKLEKYKQDVLMTAKSCPEDICVGGYTKVTPNTTIGTKATFNGMLIQGQGNCKIGRYVNSGYQCLIITQNHNYDNGEEIPYDSKFIYKDVEIGDFVWLGSRVTILPGTKIGEGAIIQGGAVVHGEIPPYAIAGGNPAKVFKYRDIEHFKKLKAEGKFH